jgi:hypothetical protein
MRSSFAAALILLLVAFAPVHSFAQRAQYDIVKIAPSVDLTPQVTFTFGPNSHPTPRSQQWLEVEVNFSSTVDWTDELQVNYYILIDNQCLTGSVTHIDVPAGRDLYSVMYVSPRTLARITNGQQLNSQDIRDVGIELVKNGQVLVTKSYKARGATQWWQNYQQVTGKVLNKNQTPFAPLIWDRYEQIKVPAGQ